MNCVTFPVGQSVWKSGCPHGAMCGYVLVVVQRVFLQLKEKGKDNEGGAK